MNENLKRAMGTFPIPGRAQISSGAKTRGIVYMAVYILLFILLIYNLVMGLQSRMTTIEAMADISPEADSVTEINIAGRTMPFIIIIIILYIIAFIDAYKFCGSVKGAEHE
ncbi:hypothetical protein KAJ27_24720 [bacterium]|nr:hypothetical protein [bacterium]